MKKIALIGSTGSIGVQTLNVCRRHPEEFKVVSLAGGQNSSLWLKQVKEFKPLVATCAKNVQVQGKKDTQFVFGENAFLDAIINEADIVVVALVGFKGIYAVLKAIELKKDVALANKESLVVGGELVIQKANQAGVNILPIDSEHSAIWQSLGLNVATKFKRLILTASGGAFRDLEIEDLNNVTASDALKHPNWLMGDKITIDCATMVNKGFEIIEAKWLFNTTFDNIDVIIHRESIIHSMVEYCDSSVVAQMGYPNMEVPISLALSYPNRLDTGVKSLDFSSLKSLSFSEVDNKKYPCLGLVKESGKTGGLYPAVINGANEVAVKKFLEGQIKFNDIYKCLAFATDSFSNQFDLSFEGLCMADKFGRDAVRKLFGE